MKPEQVRTADDARAIIEEHNPDMVTIGMVDMQGLLRGKYISREKILSALDGGYGMPLLIHALDPHDVMLDSSIADGSDGYADYDARILPETCRELPWEPGHRNLFFLSEFAGQAESVCPRAIYRRVCERAASMGFVPDHGLEYEFTLFDETSRSAAEKNYRGLQLATEFKTYDVLLRQAVWSEFYSQLLDWCRTARIVIEAAHEEMSPGFMECSIRHGTGVDIADQGALFKLMAKTVAQRRGLLLTFMARWSNQADGQSGHVHISLSGTNGETVFHDAAGDRGMSQNMRNFLGGMQALMPELLLMLGPNINSFKRFVPGIFAPTVAGWGWENRSCALRVIPGSPKSQRIECRTPGADTNPYLSLACLLGAGLHGVEQKIEPTEPVEGVIYGREHELPDRLQFPKTFSQGIERFASSTVARDLFGDEFVDVYAQTRASQERDFRGQVTDSELVRFFELI